MQELKKIQAVLASHDFSEKKAQAYNWLVVGAQKTAKTTTVLQLASSLQQTAMLNGTIKKVLIFDPMFHESFEESGIEKAVKMINPTWRIPNYRVIGIDDIKYLGSQEEDFYTWAIVRERGSRVQDFCQEALTLKNAITILDDAGSRITGNVRNFPQYIDLLAYNRINCNDVIIIYHQYKYVPPSFWQYFQRAIVKQTNEIKFSHDIFPRELYVNAQKEVEIENSNTNFPNNLRLAYRLILPQENLMFKEDSGYLISKEGRNIHCLYKDEVIAI